MPKQTKYIFSDEAGDLTFKRGQNISKYFIICTVTTTDLSFAAALVKLRRRLIWDKIDVGDYFHATTDSQEVRNQVYNVITKHSFKVQATICEKSKAQPHITSSKAVFYQYPWYYTVKHQLAHQIKDGEKLFVTAASIGTKKEKKLYVNVLEDVFHQTVKSGKWVVDFRPASCDPCLQLADYCAWAIQRKWERNDTRSYDLIKDKITREYDLWKRGAKHYY